MAKSKSFFGLRRGSTKAHTFSVWEGKQVTKDRVSEVKNPQSTAQMSQRLVLPLVAGARARLKGLVNHSFEGVEYGTDSLLYFSKINLRKGNLSVRSYIPKGATDCGLANFVIAKGTLPEVTMANVLTPAVNGTGYVTTSIISPSVPASSSSDPTGLVGWVESVLENNPDLQEGDQITFLAGISQSNYVVNDADGNEITGRYSKFVLSRIVLDPATIATQTNDGKELAVTTLTESPAAGYSNTAIDTGFIRILFNGNNLSFNVDPAILGDGQYMNMCSVIVSRKVENTWKRSNARLYVVNDKGALSYEDVISTYLKGDTSTKYLNSGSESVSITGGTSLL